MLAVVIGAVAAVSVGVAPPYDAGGVYEEVCRVVGERFYDEQMHGVDWPSACEARRGEAVACKDPASMGVVVNALLGELGASHTAFYPVGTRAWAELLDVFFEDRLWEGWPEGFVDLPVTYVGVGIVTREVEGRVFAADVYPGLPAEGAGVVVGDELVSVAGRRWTDAQPWPGGEGERVAVAVRRQHGGPVEEVMMAGVGIRPDDAFAAAQGSSLRVVEVGEERVGCVRMRTGAGEAYTGLFEGQIRGEALDGVGALVLDLRGGWGGLPLDFATRFDRDVSRFESRGRGGAWRAAKLVWQRPLVVLVDGGSRSGKEIFAHNVKRARLGVVVGERTAGAVLGGSPYPLPDGSVLYLAVMDVRVDGERIEGVGVEPDVVVPFALPYAGGADPHLEAAILEAARLAGEGGRP